MASYRHPNQRELASLPPQLRRTRVPAAVLAWVERHVGSPVIKVRRLPGASSSAVHLLRLDSGRNVVLRRWLWSAVVEEEPVLPQREVDALVFGAAHGLPVPDLLAADVTGAEVGDGIPALVMAHLPGRALPSPDHHRLAEVAAAIHAVDPAGFAHEYFEWWGTELGSPINASQPLLWEAAIEVLSAGRPPYRPVFIHRDFHPGNVLWLRGRCSGVVDWAVACAGPAGCDVAHCRGELIRLDSIDAADRLRSAYEALTGEEYHPYWELASVFDHGPSSDIPLARSELRLGRALAELGVGPGTSARSGTRSPGRPPHERRLTEDLVASLVGEQFPGLCPGVVRHVGSGWDNDVYLVDDTWAFRFPKRAEGSAWLERDIRIMAVVSDQLGSLVPRFRWFGRPSDAFPYPFVGYRWITGDDADDVPVAGLTGLARELGAALSRLHEIDPLAIPPTPAGWEDRPWSESLVELVGVADLVRPLLSDALREKAEPYLSGRVPPPAPHGSRRFVHNDLCPDHVLVDPVTGRLAGIIDFADAIVGDPVVDFVGLIGIGGRSFVAGVVGHYHHSLGEDFETRFEWLSRVVTLRSLADAAVDAASEVPRHLTWVEHAFRDSEIGDGRLLS